MDFETNLYELDRKMIPTNCNIGEEVSSEEKGFKLTIKQKEKKEPAQKRGLLPGWITGWYWGAATATGGVDG